MSTFKKITALLICMVVVCSLLASCQDGTGAGENNEPLPGDKYVATVTIKYTAMDAKIKSAIEAIGTPTVTLYADGESFKSEAFIATMGVAAESEYVLCDGVLYHFYRLSIDELAITTREKANADSTAVDQLVESIGSGASIGVEDFKYSGETKNGNATTYVCNNLNDEAKDSLCRLFAAQLATIDATVRLDSASYEVTMVRGREERSSLVCNFIVTMDGADYTVIMRLNYEYDYDREFSIAAPKDADNYKEVSIEEIIG